MPGPKPGMMPVPRDGRTGERPVVLPDVEDLPSLTLVLPAGLAGDHLVAGLAAAISQVRADLAARIRLFRRRAEESSADGERLAQALCWGQVLGADQAAAGIDEAIVEVFDLWPQYEAQLSTSGGATPSPAPAETQRLPEGLPS